MATLVSFLLKDDQDQTILAYSTAAFYTLTEEPSDTSET